MTSPRDQIAAVFAQHVDRQLTNYDTGREECGCGHQGNATHWDHLADAVLDLLRDKPELVAAILPDPLAGLIERLERAEGELLDLAEKITGTSQPAGFHRIRLAGKRDGVALALSYARECQREADR